ncbi:serine O-acetyltransferase, partial [Pseudomonas viridiflava]|uniref:serine O-acetyltransferase n=1 Tax=Pseudomonas viridiflava TaxID=33069 RepID=UPI003D328BCF
MKALWQRLREQAKQLGERNPILGRYGQDRVLTHGSFDSALAASLASQLQSHAPEADLFFLLIRLLQRSTPRQSSAAADIDHLVVVNPACP